MPTIVFATPKGGAGKSTAAVILATQFASKGAAVSLLDADPNKPLSEWARLSTPAGVTVVTGVSETTIIDEIDAAAQRAPFVIVDLAGTASMTVAYAISRADLVIVPMQGSRLDAKEGAKAITLIKQQERAFRRTIPFAVLYTRTSAAIRPRTLAFIQKELAEHKIPALQTHLHERDAFKSLFSFGGGLDDLDPKQVPGLESAIHNARQFAAEVIALLQPLQRPELVEAVNG